MSNPFVAEIRIFTGNFAPKGWAFCNGQLMPISQNTALFSLLGTTYGGDGKSTFALPNMQGCCPMQAGQGPGLSLRDLGETGGEQTVTLIQTEMPVHTHSEKASTNTGSNNVPTNAVLAKPLGRGNSLYSTATTPQVQEAFQAIGISGGGQP